MLRRKRSVSFGGFGWYVGHVEQHQLSAVWKCLADALCARVRDVLAGVYLWLSACLHGLFLICIHLHSHFTLIYKLNVVEFTVGNTTILIWNSSMWHNKSKGGYIRSAVIVDSNGCMYANVSEGIFQVSVFLTVHAYGLVLFLKVAIETH